MRKSHFHLRFRLNLAAHDHAHTLICVYLIDPPEPMERLAFSNVHPEQMAWDWEVRSHQRFSAVAVDILSDKHTRGGRPAVWLDIRSNEYHRLRRIRATGDGRIRYHELFSAADTPPF